MSDTTNYPAQPYTGATQAQNTDSTNLSLKKINLLCQEIQTLVAAGGGGGGGGGAITAPLGSQVSAASVAITPASDAVFPLPTGASTATNQATLNTNFGAQADAAATTDTGAFSLIAFVKRLLEGVTSISGKLPALVSGLFPVLTSYATSTGNGSAQTSATGANWVALTSQACKAVSVINNSTVSISVRIGGAGVGLPIAAGASFPFEGISNANTLEVQRTDQSNTQITIYYNWLA